MKVRKQPKFLRQSGAFMNILRGYEIESNFRAGLMKKTKQNIEKIHKIMKHTKKNMQERP